MLSSITEGIVYLHVLFKWKIVHRDVALGSDYAVKSRWLHLFIHAAAT